MSISVESFFLPPDGQGTLQTQIQQIVAEGILSGRLRRGEKLPSTRKMATHLSVSRITVTLAYTELLANDYLSSKGRSGYYVSENAPEPASFPPQPETEETVDWARAIGQRFSGGVTLAKPQDWSSYKYPFIYGQTDPRLFDHSNWRQCALRALGQKDFGPLTSDYYDQDDPMLLDYIARHILPRRGVFAKPDEILVTMGAQNALWMTTQILLTQRRTAVVEDPSYPGLRDILTQSRCHVTPVPVDVDGLPPELIPPESDVIFTTPSHQCPTTLTMPLPRRKALLERARELDAIVVEDDYEFEMSFLKPPLPALKSLDKDGRVIYVGSFSKSLFPGLRLGYLVGSKSFIREARALRASVLRHVPGHTQRTAAYFLSLGHYGSHIKRMGDTLKRRRSAMEEAIANQGLTVAGSSAFGGSSYWMRAPKHVDASELARSLRAKGVLIEPGHAFIAAPSKGSCHYRLGYSSIPTSKIADGIALLAQGIAEAS